jgi:hypothetical protein
MNCVHVIVPVVYVFLLLKTMRQWAKCQDIACQNLKDGTTDYRREVWNDPARFTEKGLRFRKLSFYYLKMHAAVFVVGGVILIVIFAKH